MLATEKVKSPPIPRTRCPISDIVTPVVIKNPADFVGSALGESEKNTKAILDATVGKVLVIDEVNFQRTSLSQPLLSAS